MACYPFSLSRFLRHPHREHIERETREEFNNTNALLLLAALKGHTRRLIPYVRMFNLQEKKVWIQDLASQLVQFGNGQAQPDPFLENNNGIAIDPPGLKLEDVALFKQGVMRSLFMAKCLQLHAASGRQEIGLPIERFELMTDIFRVILREGNNEADFSVIRMVYQAAGLFGICVGKHIKTIRVRNHVLCVPPKSSRLILSVFIACLFDTHMKMVLRTHEAWRNFELWRTTLDELIARDQIRWLNLQSALQEVFGFDLSNDQIIKLMMSFRLKSIGRPDRKKMGEYEVLPSRL